MLGAQLRLEGEEPVTGHAARVILGALARVEAANGNRDRAQEYYAEALEVPGVDFPLDRLLLRELTAEAEALDASSSSMPPISSSRELSWLAAFIDTMIENIFEQEFGSVKGER